MSIWRSLLLLLVLLISLPLIIYNQSNQASTSSDSIQLSNLQLYQVERGIVALTVNAIGTIEPNQVVQLSFLTAGRVEMIIASRDEYVLAGDELIYLDNETQRINFDQAMLSLNRAELAYDDLLIVDDNAILLAQASVDAAIGQYQSVISAVTTGDLQAADLAYQQALEAAEQLRIERDNIGGQFGGDSNEWIQAQARYGQATFDAEIARLQADRLRNINGPQAFAASVNIDVARAELQRVLAGPSEAEIESALISIEQAELQAERTQTAYERTILTAPFNGVITQLNIEEGSLVAPGLTVIELMDVDTLGLTVQVDEIDIGLVELNQPVRVTLDALPDVTLPATVTDIAPLGTPSGGIVSYDVEIQLDGQDSRIRVGMTAEANIIIQEAPDVLFVPNLYIRRDRNSDRAFVNVLREDNSIEEIEVEIGIQGRESSEILSGLTEGDLVAIDLTGRGLNILGGQ